MIELLGHQLPAAIQLPEDHVGRHAHVLVEGDVGAHTSDRVDRRHREPRQAGVHHEHGDSLVERGVRVRARCEPHVVGALGAAGENLLSVDDVMITVAHGARLEGGQIAACRGLRVTNGKGDLAAGDARQELALLFLRASPDERRPDGVHRHEGKRRLGKPQLLHQDFLGERVERPATVLQRPAGGEPARLAHAPDDGSVEFAALAAPAHLLALLRRHEVGQIGAELAAQRNLPGGVFDVHGGFSLRRTARCRVPSGSGRLQGRRCRRSNRARTGDRQCASGRSPRAAGRSCGA